MFDLDDFLSCCDAARGETDPRRTVTELLHRTMTDHADVATALASTPPGLTVLLESPDLTVVHAVWTPRMSLLPHNHRMWAAIGIYGGQEDNTLYRRSQADSATVEVTGGRELREGDVFVLGDDAIHSVTNPLHRITGAIHVYGGDFVNEPRSQWGPGEPRERAFDLDYVRSLFS